MTLLAATPRSMTDFWDHYLPSLALFAVIAAVVVVKARDVRHREPGSPLALLLTVFMWLVLVGVGFGVVYGVLFLTTR